MAVEEGKVLFKVMTGYSTALRSGVGVVAQPAFLGENDSARGKSLLLVKCLLFGTGELGNLECGVRLLRHLGRSESLRTRNELDY